MKKIFLISLIMIGILNLKAQDKSLDVKYIPETMHIFGKIDDKYEFTMSLYINVEKKIVIGSYYYNNKKTPIKLKGNIKGDKIHLKETVKGKVTGSFDFKIGKDYSIGKGVNISYPDKENKSIYISGKWSSKDKSKQFDLNISEVRDMYLNFDRVIVNRSRGAYGKEKINVDLEYPFFDGNNGNIDSTINRHLANLGYGYNNKGIDKLKREFDSYVHEKKPGKYNLSVECTVLLNSEDILSIKEYWYKWGEFTGTSEYSTTLYNINVKTGEKIKLEDIIKDLTTLEAIAKEVFYEKYELDENKSLPSQYFDGFPYDKFYLEKNNFSLNSKGIIFNYGFVAQTSSQGETIFTITWDKLERLLNPEVLF